MATARDGRYGPAMKTWSTSKWLYLIAAATGAASLSLQAWIALSGGVVHWWVMIPTMATVACTFEFVRTSKPETQ
jgi:hypothetical protein